MVFVDPTSLTMSPVQPTDSTDLSFTFIGVRDTADFFLILYSPIYYIMYRTTRATTDKTGWTELGRYVDQYIGGEVGNNTVTIPANKKLPAGVYDFIAVESADWNGAGRDDPRRIGYITKTIERDCSDPVVLCTAACISQATCTQCPSAPGCGTVYDTDKCAPGSPYINEPMCAKTECNMMCQFNNAFGTVVEPVKQYVPYIVAGVVGIVVLTLLFKKRKAIVDLVKSKSKDKDEL